MKIIVPIAGRATRFKKASESNPEYGKPKPLIDIKGKPMVMWALESLPFLDLPHRPAKTKDMKVSMSDVIFISLQEHQDDYKIADKLKKIFTNKIKVILLPDVTRGALETALEAKKYMGRDEIIITDCDHYFNGMGLYNMLKNRDKDTKGIIPVFPPPDEEVKWSYTLFDPKTKIVTAVAEKDPVLAARGAMANIGAYTFTSGTVFVTEAEAMIRDNDMAGPEGKKEFFIAPMYQRMINKGLKVQAAVCPDMWGLGTPKDVEVFLREYKG